MSGAMTSSDILALMGDIPHKPSFDESSMVHIADELAEFADSIERSAARYLRDPFTPNEPQIDGLITTLVDELASSFNIFDGRMNVENAEDFWLENLRWLGQQLELIRTDRFWCATQGNPDLSTLVTPITTKALFARAVFLARLADSIATGHETQYAITTLVEAKALVTAIKQVLNQQEGAAWVWSERILQAQLSGIEI